ncbi:MAG: hypothetical protein AAFX55_13215 [Bacteroidota bacterium]
MYIRNNSFFLLVLLLLFACNNDVKKEPINVEVDETKYVIDSTYVKGDLRRYGIHPDKYFSRKQWDKVLDLASEGMPLTFKKGTYYGNLIFDGVKDVNIFFDDATIAGEIQIINNGDRTSQGISLLGEVTVLDKVFIRKSEKIEFGNLYIYSDTINDVYQKNRGLSIYAGSKDIKIDTLKINDTGGNSEKRYKFTAAAMQVHGHNDNPERIEINVLKITNAARSGIYLTGNDHKIRKITIENFGFGSNISMFGLEDAKPEAHKLFSGAWFNKCNDCTIDTLVIKSRKNSKAYSARFDLGTYSKPCIINNIKFEGEAKKMPIEDDVLTNVLVKNVLKDDN